MKNMIGILDVRPYELMFVVCVLGRGGRGAGGHPRLTRLLKAVRADPAQPLRLRCNTSGVYRFQNPGPAENTSEPDPVNVKRDLDILQRLGLTPGAIRPASDLFRTLLEVIPDAREIAGFHHPATSRWPACSAFTADDYARGRAMGWRIVVGERPASERRETKQRTARELLQALELRIRPHHLMCMACFWGDRETAEPIEEDHLAEAVLAMRARPDIPVVLIEGCCMICPPCAAYRPDTGLCIGKDSMSLRDEKKDLDVLFRLDLHYGDRLPARELLSRLFSRIETTTAICGFGDGVARSPEWRLCHGPEGNSKYVQARRVGLRVPGVVPAPG